MKHIIDIETWERRDNYNFFRNFHSLTARSESCRAGYRRLLFGNPNGLGFV